MKSWLYPNGACYDKVHILNLYGIKDYRGGIATKSIKVFLYYQHYINYIERLNYCVYTEVRVDYIGIG